MICHIKDMLSSGLSTISVRTVDSDVIVIILAFIPQLLLEINPAAELIVDLNTGVHRNNIFYISECFQSLGEEMFPLFHRSRFYLLVPQPYPGLVFWLEALPDEWWWSHQGVSATELAYNRASVSLCIAEFASYVYSKKVVDVLYCRWTSIWYVSSV